MSASLVGSEMCIRDSPRTPREATPARPPDRFVGGSDACAKNAAGRTPPCLLYTSDAADDM
eukprot:13781992-Alexandrium_andersonii.AAC.1